MKKTLIILSILCMGNAVFAQQLPAHLEGQMTYPVFDFDPWVGVVKKKKVKALKYDKDLTYKIAVDVYDSFRDSTRVIRPLREVARSFNLNVANGVPKRKLDMAVVVHGEAIYAFLNDEAYQRVYGVPNPNLEAIRIMKKEGIEFYICGQVLSFWDVPFEYISKEIDITLSAKTALITLDQRGYSYLNVNEN